MQYDSISPVRIVPRAQRLEAVQRRLEAYSSQLNWSVDALIPADPSLKMPSASEAGVLDNYLPEVLVLRDDLAETFYSALAQLPMDKPADPLKVMHAMGAKYFDCFSRLIAGAFFLNPDVNASLGYSGQETILENPDYDYIIEAIEPLIERGEIYTPV